MIHARSWFNKLDNIEINTKLFKSQIKKIPYKYQYDSLQNLTPEQIIENHNNRQYETSIFYLEANNAGGTDYLWDGLKFRDDCDYYFFCATEDVYPPNFKNSSNIVFGTRGKNPSFPVFLKSFCENLATVKVTGDVAASGFAEAGSGAAGGP